MYLGQLIFSFLLLWSFYCQALEPNHAPLSPKHNWTAENFITRNFKVGDEYDLNKFDDFIIRLEKEYKALKSDIYEGAIIETIDIHGESIEDAKERALEQIREDKHNLLHVFKNYLLPEAKQIREAVADGTSRVTIDAMIDHFIELYHVYYVPELPRNRWEHDRALSMRIKALTGLRYSKIEKKSHANNLIVGEYLEEIVSCLPSVESPNHILSQEQLERLEGCGFDLSLLEPIQNPFIKKLTISEKEKRKTDFLKLFPKADENFYFEFMIYNGAGSPKFVASFYKDIAGERKKITLKVKLGKETHQDPATSMLGKLIGLSQDHSIAYPQMKLYLKDISIETFIARWRSKYKTGLHDISKYIVEQSPRGATEQWVILRDVSVEIRDPVKRRLTPYDPWGWDLPNRREHRGIALWYAFVAMRDMKSENHVVHFIEKEGGYELEYSAQDVGISLGSSVDLRYPLGSLAGASGKTVNHYRPSFLSYSKEHLHIHWVDTITNRQKFRNATYDDMRWMARKIVALTMEDFDYALTIGGFPKPVIELYKIKMGMRRNEIIKAFELEDEFDLWQLPELNSYNDLPYIRNGVVFVDGFEGHVLYQANTYSSDITRNILDLTSRYLPIEQMRNGINAALDNGLSLGHERVIGELQGSKLGKFFTYEAISGSIKFQINRNIILNDADYASGPDSMGRYIVKDTLTIGFNVGSELNFDLIKNFIPVTIRPKGTVYERSYAHMQVADNWKEAFKAPFKIFAYSVTPMASVTHDLFPGDVFKIQDRVDFNIDASVGVNLTQSPFLKLDFEAGVGWSYSRPLYIHRDHAGDILLFRESRKDFMINAGGSLLGIDFTYLDEFPLLGISYTYDKISKQSELYRFEVATGNGSTYRKRLQQRELESFFDGGNPVFYLKNKVLDLRAHGYIQRFQLDFMLFLHAARSSSFFKITVDGQEGRKNFYRYHLMSESFIGDKKLGALIQSNPWILVKQQDQWAVNIELEEQNISTATAVLEYQDFRQKLSKRSLLNFIDNVGLEFSPDGEHSIFSTSHLPPEWEVKNYFKVFSFMRVHVGIGKFISNITPNSYQQVKRRIYAKSRELGLRLPRAFLYILRRGINQIRRHKNNPARQVKAVASMLRYINKLPSNVRLLKEVVGEENVFVFGELIGVYYGYTLTQEQDAIPTRRFAAKSWGGLTGVPPIRRYLKDNLVAPIYLHLLSDDITEDVFGKLPSTGGPPIF